MLKRIIRRYTREPLANIAVLIFAAVLTVILCHLQRSQEEELQNFRETYRAVPVYFSVTDLDGSQLRGSRSIEGWVAELFFPNSRTTPNFSKFVKDLKIRMELEAYVGEFSWEDQEDYYRQLNDAERVNLVGINALRVAERLTEEYAGSVRWYEGYSEEVLETEERVCLVSEDYEGSDEIALSFTHDDVSTGEKKVYSCTFTVVGRYSAMDVNDIYCPYFVLDQIYGKILKPRKILCLSATLADNNLLGELKETAPCWFAEPSPMGTKTPWGRFGYEYYLYAMDINDSLLKELVTTMENSITINRLSSTLIFAMSALAGFLTGFLVIRSRKREITLMRTLGNSNMRIYFEFALEQFLCLFAGVLIGGGYALWNPLWKLAVFAVVNFVGLSAALVVFLNSNLLSTMKEDE